MKYKTLGDTGLLVSTLCFGTMTFSWWHWHVQGHRSGRPKGRDELIKASIDAGINFFDTADVYSEGESEKIQGQALKNLGIARKDVVLATKVFGRVGPGRNDVGASRGHIMDAVEASLRRLQTDHIDLYQIHGTDTITPLEETLAALDTLVNQGKVRYIGCSNWQAWRIAKALGISERRNLARLDTFAGLLLHRGPRPRARAGSAHGVRESRPAGLESLGRWFAVGKIQSREPEARRLAPLGIRFSHRGQGTHMENPRCRCAHHQGARYQRGPHCHCLAVGQARGDFGDHRGKRLDQLHDNIAAVDLKLRRA